MPVFDRQKMDSWGQKDWLGREGSNLRMAESKSAALPLGDAPNAAPYSRATLPPQQLARGIPCDYKLGTNVGV
jgi:hypothetical protein